MSERHLVLEGGYNVRDLGGYQTADGRLTRWKVLLRSGNLDKLSPIAQQNLIDYGVRAIVDLRDESEVEEAPNVFERSTSVIYHHLPLIGNGLSQDKIWKAKSESYETLKDLYTIYLADCQRQIGTIVSAIADSEGCTLFHCFAGKDRTGVIAALILRTVGVSQAVIAEDYSLTEHHIKHLHEDWQKWATEQGQDRARFEEGISARAVTMMGLLETIAEEYGDAHGYLTQCGVLHGQIERLRTRFVG
jgi:protein-tyrosine phosphatase